MNKTDKERLLRIVKNIESYIDTIEEIQDKESAKHSDMSEKDKQSEKGRTVENNCWLIQPLHDFLEDALSTFETIEDLIDPSTEDFDLACSMANYYKQEFYRKNEFYLKNQTFAKQQKNN